LLLQKGCGTSTDCFRDGLPGQLATIANNVRTILSALRATGFKGVLMVVTYYSLDYSDPTHTAVIAQLNQAITAHAPANGAVVADVFEAFKAAASTSAGGKTCNAGLLNVDPRDQSSCDAHPSQSGQKLIAQTIESVYAAAVTSATMTDVRAGAAP
jgi:lysophospholipase L1-like esterase